VERFQIAVVSRWLVMPIAVTMSGRMSASASPFLQQRSTVFQISRRSCSTQPAFGKCCVNSRYASPTTSSRSSTTSTCVPVVP